MKQIFNKLVRDLIPQKIESEGRKVYTRKLDDEEMLSCLERKLVEEVNEYLQDKTIEELADILEVIYAICKVKGINLEELERARMVKCVTNGAFEEKIFLEYTED